MRTFRLDRVQDAAATDRTFEKPAGFDPLAHVQQSIAQAPWTWWIEAVLDLPIEQARHPPGHGVAGGLRAGCASRSRAEQT